MRSFANFVANKDLAEFIVENEIDVDTFCETVLELYSKEVNLNEQNLNEFIQKLARGISGLFGAPAGMARDAGSAIGRGAMAAGSAIGRGAMAAGSAIGRGAQAAGKYVGDKYEAGRRAEAVRQVNDRLKGLENALVSLGLDKAGVGDFVSKLNAHLQQAIKSGQIGKVHKAGDYAQAVKQKMSRGGHEAWEGLGKSMAAQQRGKEMFQQVKAGQQPTPAPIT